MSIQLSDAWFDRGQVLGVAANTSTADLKVGTRKIFADVNPATGVLNSNEVVECVCVRNISGGTLAAKTVVKFASANLLGEVDAVADVDSVRIGVIDEYLTAGCADDEVCWVVTKGPVTALSDGSINQGVFVSVGTSGTAGDIVGSVANKTVGYSLAAASGGNIRINLLGRNSTP